MNRLVAIALPPGAAFVDAIKQAWDDDDAVLPIDSRLPAPAVGKLLEAMKPACVIEPGTVSALENSESVEGGDALVMATSGTTGEPKGVVLTHDAVVASALATSQFLDVDPATDGWLSCLPLAHIGGLSVVLRAMITGTPVVVQQKFDPAAVELATADGSTLVSMVPTMLQRCDTSGFRKVVLGGSAPPADRPDNCHITYGLTETGSGVVYDHVPLTGVEVKTLDGELWLKGPMLCRGYRDGTSPIDADGWLATGDAGTFVDGRVEVHGRVGDMIISGGQNVWPTPVERILASHPSVGEVAVVGRKDPEWGQRVTAVVVPASSEIVVLEQLRDLVKAELPSYCAPHGLEIVKGLPKTALGKVVRAKL